MATTTTTTDTTTTTTTNSTETPAASTAAPPSTSTWTKYLPEAYGIRESIENSPYRWCVREAAMWGIATGTAMGIHRLRMKSHPFFAFNIGFITTFLVVSPSYYFCFRRRDHKEQVIELMMRANDFKHEEEAPPEIEMKEHPFLTEDDSNSNNREKSEEDLQREFVGRLKERKEWQSNFREEEILEELKDVRGGGGSK